MQTLIPITRPDGKPALPGFRLKRLELLNWGTFNGKVEQLLPDCRWTLISGSNGTGKSTAADAIRTLLVPPGKLTYNDASLDQKVKHSRRDRSKKTYIRGAYGASSQEDSATAILQFHREEGVQSILLAVFTNEYTHVDVTLAQILWMNNDEHDQEYLIARQDRSISRHLVNLGKGREIKKTLATNGFEICQSFAAYETKFRHLLGIPGEGALDVFNQVIGVKEVHDLNVFVRRHLLEPSDTPRYIVDHLKPHFTQLSACYDAIQRADAQLVKLRPIADRYVKMAEAEKTKTELEKTKLLLPFHYSQQELELRRAQDESLEAEQVQIKNEQEALEKLQVTDGEQKQSILNAMSKEDAFGRLAAIEREMREAMRVRDEKLKQLETIKRHLGVLHQIFPLASAENLTAMRYKLLTDKGALDGNLTAQESKKIDAAISKRSLEDARKSLALEAESVRKNQVLIPSRLLAIRELICADTGLAVMELPFAGELMEVKDEHREWTGAIERLLHGFGISLLVPESRYPQVARYINGAHLGSRLDFFKIPASLPSDRLDILHDSRRVPSRLNFKSDSPLIRWVQSEIARRFDHFCCTDVDHLNKVDFGLTQAGLFRNGTRHTKNDSAKINDRSSYVLGWNLQDKLDALIHEIAGLTGQLKDNEGKITNATEQIKTIRAKLAAIEGILLVDDFDQINPVPQQQELERLNAEHERLTKSSNKLQELKSELAAMQLRLDNRQKELNALFGKLGGITDRRGVNSRRIIKLKEYMLDAPEDLEDAAPVLKPLQDNAELSLDNLEDVCEVVERKMQNRLNTCTHTITSATAFLIPEMADFLAKFPEERAELKAQVDFGPDFVKLTDAIENEKLPAHKARFFSLLNRDLILNLAAFNSKLAGDEKAIKDRIATVNSSLRAIKFTPDTYVQVVLAPAKSDEVKVFRAELRSCLSSGILPTEEQQTQIYERIQKLISRFDKDPDWTQRVTDVRNWLEYGVKRLAEVDNSEVEYYAGSSGKSGGQKSLLALTIMASAVTVQYGLKGNGDRDNFRLVVVDEVFGKTDEEYSQRALELFKKLDLQLVIVNPYDAKSRIVENYVHSYHLVSARDDLSTLKRATRAEYEETQN